MAYTAYQIISFILFLILICLSVILIVLSSVAAKNGGGIFSSASKMASSAATTAKDFAIIKKLESQLLMNQIKLTPKEYLIDMKSLYNETTFRSYLEDTIAKAKARTAANSGLIDEYKRRNGDGTYIKEKGTYQQLIDKYTKDNESLVEIIHDCTTLLSTKLVPNLLSAITPIIDPEITKMTSNINLRGTDLMSTIKSNASNAATYAVGTTSDIAASAAKISNSIPLIELGAFATM